MCSQETKQTSKQKTKQTIVKVTVFPIEVAQSVTILIDPHFTSIYTQIERLFGMSWILNYCQQCLAFSCLPQMKHLPFTTCLRPTLPHHKQIFLLQVPFLDFKHKKPEPKPLYLFSFQSTSYNFPHTELSENFESKQNYWMHISTKDNQRIPVTQSTKLRPYPPSKQLFYYVNC